jgi:uncharacterized iron-regulated membrane protein
MGVAGSVYLVFACATGVALVLYRTVFGPGKGAGFLNRLHSHLLIDSPGLMVNAVGGLLLTLMGLTGVVIWWPGVKRWRRALKVPMHWGASGFSRRLHRVVGFWTSAFVVMFGVTGLLLSIPGRRIARALTVVQWFGLDSELTYKFIQPAVGLLHSGPSRHWFIQVIWALAGTAPLFLTVTGVMIWQRHRQVSNRREAVR